MAEKNVSRRSFLKKSIYAGTATGGALLLGGGIWSLLKENSIDDLYGEYPLLQNFTPGNFKS